MTENRREVRAILRYDIDNSSLQKAVQSTRQVEAALGKVRGETAATEVTAKRLQAELQALGRNRQIDGIAQDFARAALEGRDLERETARVVERLRALGATEAEIRRVARAYDQAEQEARQFAQASAQAALGPAGAAPASGGQPGVLGRAGAAIRNLPSMQIPGAGGLATDAVGNILRVSDTLIASIAGLGPVGIAAAAATAAVTAALGLYLTQMNKVAEAERRRLDIETEIYEQARRQTRGELVADIVSTMRDAEIAAARAQDLRRDLFEAWSDLTPLEQLAVQAGGIGTRASEAAVRWAELNDELTEQDTKTAGLVERAQSQIRALEDEATARRDSEEATRLAVEEEKRLADARRAAILATADEARQNALENARYAGMSQQQLQAERDRLQADSRATRQAMETILDGAGVNIDDLRATIDRMGLSAAKADEAIRKTLQAQGVDSGLIDAFLAYREQLRQNQDDINRLTQVYIPLAGQTQALADAAVSAEKALADMTEAARAVSAQAEKVRDAEAALADVRSRANAAIGQAEQRVRDAEAKGEEQRLEILRRANDQAAKIAADYGIARVRAEEDLARALKRIHGDINQAVQDRNAVEFDRAKERANEAEEDARVEARRRREDYQRRLNELAQATSRELQVLRQRTNDAVAAARAALDIERQKWQGEINLRQQALNAMLQQYNIFLSALRSAQAQAGRVVIQPQTVQVPQTGNPYADFAAYQRSQGVPGFAEGGYPPVGRPVLVGERGPELVTFGRQARVFSAADTRRILGNGGSRQMAATLRLDGPATTRLLRGEAVNVLAEFVEGYEAAS